MNPVDGFALALYGTEGETMEWLQFETLDIALDQATDILGIPRDGWEACRADLPEGPVFPDQFPPEP